VGGSIPILFHVIEEGVNLEKKIHGSLVRLRHLAQYLLSLKEKNGRLSKMAGVVLFH
jgi:hypothetical protein